MLSIGRLFPRTETPQTTTPNTLGCGPYRVCVCVCTWGLGASISVQLRRDWVPRLGLCRSWLLYTTSTSVRCEIMMLFWLACTVCLCVCVCVCVCVCLRGLRKCRTLLQVCSTDVCNVCSQHQTCNGTDRIIIHQNIPAYCGELPSLSLFLWPLTCSVFMVNMNLVQDSQPKHGIYRHTYKNLGIIPKQLWLKCLLQTESENYRSPSCKYTEQWDGFMSGMSTLIFSTGMENAVKNTKSYCPTMSFYQSIFSSCKNDHL